MSFSCPPAGLLSLCHACKPCAYVLLLSSSCFQSSLCCPCLVQFVRVCWPRRLVRVRVWLAASSMSVCSACPRCKPFYHRLVRAFVPYLAMLCFRVTMINGTATPGLSHDIYPFLCDPGIRNYCFQTCFVYVHSRSAGGFGNIPVEVPTNGTNIRTHG